MSHRSAAGHHHHHGSNSAPREVRVFVSSTFRDMQNERQTLMNDAFQQLRLLCERRGVAFSAVDFRWGITDDETADGQALAMCLAEIDRCRPYFVGMLGERYGWSQQRSSGSVDEALARTFEVASAKYPWVRGFTDRSITELEFIYGALQPELSASGGASSARASASSTTSSSSSSSGSSSTSSRAFVYLRDPLYVTKTFALGSPERPDFESEGDESYRKLSNLKQRVLQSSKCVVREDYANPQQLSEWVLEDLTRAIEQDFPAPPSSLSSSSDSVLLLASPSVDPDASSSSWTHHATQQSSDFVGRATLLRLLTSFVHTGNSAIVTRSMPASAAASAAPPAASNLVVLTGAGGIGKTALLSRWLLSLRSSAPAALPIVHFVGAGTPHCTSANHIVLKIMRELKSSLSLSMPLPELSDPELVQQFTALLHSAQTALLARKQFVVLVVDGVDQLSSLEDRNMRWLPHDWPSSFRVILSAADTVSHGTQAAAGDDDDDDDEEPAAASDEARGSGRKSRALKALLSRELPVIELGTLVEAERAQLVTSYLASLSKKLDANLVQTLARSRNTGSPLFLRVVLDQLAHYGTYDKLDQQLRALVNARSIAELYEQVLSNWESALAARGHASAIGNVLKVLWCSRYGISEEDLFAASGVARAVWMSLFALIRSSLVSTLPGMLAIAHLDLRSAIALRYLATSELQQRAHRSYASYLATLPKQSPFVIRERPWALYQSGPAAANVEELARVISDLEVLPVLFAPGARRDLFRFWDWVEAHSSTTATSAFQRSVHELQCTGPSASTLSSVFHLLSAFFQARGAFAIAINYAKQALSHDRTLHGRTSEQVAATTLELASLACSQGEFATAIHFADKALALYGGVGAKSAASKANKTANNHAAPKVIECLVTKALVHKKQAVYGEARALYELALTQAEAFYGASQPEVAHLLCLAADIDRKTGALGVAEATYRKALRILEAKVGKHHPSAIALLRSLGLVHKKQGQYAEAEQMYRQALTALAGTLGKSNPSYGILLSDLADTYRKRGNLVAAESAYKKALEILERTLGPLHADVSDPLNSLGLLLKKRGQYLEARHLYDRAIRIIENRFGRSHYKYALVLSNIADVDRKSGLYASALQQYEQCLQILQACLGPDHAEVADVLTCIGLVHKKLSRYPAALANYERARQILEAQLGSRHTKLGVLFYNMADVYRKQRDYVTAWKFCENSLDILEHNLGSEHSEVAEVLHSMAKLHNEQHQYREAEAKFARAISIVKKELGEAHPKIGLYTNSIGEAFQYQKQYAAARSSYVAALANLKQSLGPKHPEVADVYTNLGDCYLEEGMKPQAVQAFKEAWSIVRVALGTTHPKFAALIDAIQRAGGDVSSLLGNASSAAHGANRRTRRPEAGRRAPQPMVALYAMGWL